MKNKNSIKPKKGDPLFVVSQNSRFQLHQECIVTKVGREYFEIDLLHNVQFCNETWCQVTHNSYLYIIYKTKQDWLNCIK